MSRRPPRSTRTDTHFPYTTLFRSIGKEAVLAEQVGDNAALEPIHVEQRMFDRNRRAAEQPCLELMAGRAIGAVIVEQVEPRLLLALRREGQRSEEHTSELQSLMRTSYAVFCFKKKTTKL